MLFNLWDFYSKEIEQKEKRKWKKERGWESGEGKEAEDLCLEGIYSYHIATANSYYAIISGSFSLNDVWLQNLDRNLHQQHHWTETSTERRTFSIHFVQETTKYLNQLQLFDEDTRSHLIIKLNTLLPKVSSTKWQTKIYFLFYTFLFYFSRYFGDGWIKCNMIYSINFCLEPELEQTSVQKGVKKIT